MNKIIILVLSLVLISCEKKDRIEIDNIDGYKVEKKFKNDTLVSSKTIWWWYTNLGNAL